MKKAKWVKEFDRKFRKSDFELLLNTELRQFINSLINQVLDEVPLWKIDEVEVSKNIEGKWKKIGKSEEARYGWNSAINYLEIEIKKLKIKYGEGGL